MKKCQACGHNRFYQDVTVKADLTAIVDGNGAFCDFVGNIEDQIDESQIVDREKTLTCTECGEQYDPDAEGEDED